jgi:hypothetical protein
MTFSPAANLAERTLALWRTHPGDVVLSNDLLVINLRDPAGKRTGAPLTHLSVYDVSYSPVGSGHIAFMRLEGAPDATGPEGCVLTDNLHLVPWFRNRLDEAGWSLVALDRSPLEARFERSQLSNDLRLRIEAHDLLVRASWQGLSMPRWMGGRSGNYPSETQWALLIEASEASVTVNGVRGQGAPYPDERFVSMLGRSVSSCQLGLCEIHLRRGRAPRGSAPETPA